MMRTLGALLSLCVSVPALATTPSERASPSNCASLDKVRAAAEGFKIVDLTPGQFHFMEGFYVALPSTPPGLPPGDGAFVMVFHTSNDGILFWTRGKLACSPMNIPHIDKLIKVLDDIKTGQGEGDPA